MLKGTLAASALVLSLSLAAPAHAAGRDAIGGAVLGAAVGGGVAAYRRYVSSESSWGNWQRDVAIGAGIGLAAGLILGAVDASSNADKRFYGPVADERRVGFGAPSAAYGARF